jgi:ABC-type amino acid transport substrate-binding protein
MGLRRLLLYTSCLAVLFTFVKGWDDEYLTGDHQPARLRRAIPQTEIATVFIPTEYYVMATADGKWEGFIIDLLKEMEKDLVTIKFKTTAVKDGMYGHNKNGNWTGMIGEVVRGEVLMAAGPITVTAQREEVVDFLRPFKHVGLTLLIKKPHMDDPDKDMSPINFQVLYPFAPEVWCLCVMSFIVVGVVIWAMNKINPYEWGGRYSLGRATEHQAEAFNFSGSMWFAFTTLQWQGFERSPRSLGSRVMASFWFMFVTISIVTFTGALVNHLFWASTVHGKDLLAPPFRTLEELLMAKDYQYGTIAKGSTHTYLTAKAKGEEFDIIKRYFESDEGKKNLFSSTKDAIKRVREGKFAFIMESSSAQHHIRTLPCDLMTVGEIFAPRSYGFAISHTLDRDITDALHASILRMHENGVIDDLEKKWVYERGECWNVTKMEKVISQANSFTLNKPKQITVDMFWGPLVLLTVGVILSILIGTAEVFYYKYKGRYDSKNRPGSTPLNMDQDEML